MDPLVLFKALSDATRLRCIALLARNEELCVCELTEVLRLPQPKVSHHLAALRRAGLVSDRKQGLWIHYRINPDLPAWCDELLTTAVEGFQMQAPYVEDSGGLRTMTGRSGVVCG